MNPFIAQAKKPQLQKKRRNENAVTREVWQILKELPNSWWMKVHGTAYGRVGIPDIVGCYHGRFMAFEIKADRNKYDATPNQKEQIRKINRAGGAAHVVDGEESLNDILAKVDRGDI